MPDIAPFETEFAHSVVDAKYMKPHGETHWYQTADRAVHHPIRALSKTSMNIFAIDDAEIALRQLVRKRHFMPGGRYLYASGNDMHQVQNCFSGDTRILTEAGAVSMIDAAGSSVRVRNRHGLWEDASVECFGEQELYEVEFVNGEKILVTADHRWWQLDGSRVTTNELESVPFSSVEKFPELDAEGVRHGIIFGDGHLIRNRYSQIVFVNPAKDQSLVSWFKAETREVVVGGGAVLKIETVRDTKRGTIVSLQPKHYKSLPTSYSPEYARGFIAGLIATDGCVPLTGSVQVHCEGLSKARSVAEIAVAAGCVVNSVRVVSRVSPYTGEPREMSCVSIKPFSAPCILPSHKDRLDSRNLRRNFRPEVAVESVTPTGRFEPVYCAVVPGSESFTLANGLITSNCLLLSCEDTREGWADMAWKAEMSLLTGAGIGIYWGNVRGNGVLVKRTGGTASGPVPKMISTNEQGRAAVQGGDRRSAIWAGLPWWHSDVFWFMSVKNWPDYLKEAKLKDPSIPAPMDMTNISVCLDDEFFMAFEQERPESLLVNGAYSAPDGGTWAAWARRVYWTAIDQMTQTGEPGFSVDLGEHHNEKLRNACTEIVSADDSDICNLGGLVLPRFERVQDFENAVRMGALYLTAGSVYSDVPYERVAEIREKNRRLGLDLMGVHEFLLMRGLTYGTDDSFEALEPFMRVYDRALEFAHDWQDKAGLSHSVAATSGAPTGTRAIGAETTTGHQVVTAAAYKRLVITSKAHESDLRTAHYVVDPTVARLVKQGYISADDVVEDSYALANDYERVFRHQAYAQSHTDQAISMTVNLPHVMTDATERRKFGLTLYKYLPQLRGITVYPNGAIAGQPITPVPLAEALAANNVTIEEDEDKCASGVCGL